MLQLHFTGVDVGKYNFHLRFKNNIPVILLLIGINTSVEYV
jgi:hypothetical protein